MNYLDKSNTHKVLEYLRDKIENQLRTEKYSLKRYTILRVDRRYITLKLLQAQDRVHM